MGNKFLEKFAPFYFLMQSMGWVPVIGTLLGLFVWITQGKKLQHGTRSMYLVMALWAVAANGLTALVLFLMLTADPTVATEVSSM